MVKYSLRRMRERRWEAVRGLRPAPLETLIDPGRRRAPDSVRWADAHLSDDLTAFLWRNYRTVDDAIRRYQAEEVSRRNARHSIHTIKREMKAAKRDLTTASESFHAALKNWQARRDELCRAHHVSFLDWMFPDMEFSGIGLSGIDFDDLGKASKAIQEGLKPATQEYERCSKAVSEARRSIDTLRSMLEAPWRHEVCEELLSALGSVPFDFAAGRTAIDLWSRRRPKRGDLESRRRVVGDLRRWILPLLVLFEDPRRFFAQTAPLLWTMEFAQHGPKNTSAFHYLLRHMRKWGPGVLLNPRVRQCFDEMPPRELASLLSSIDDRHPFKADGRPRTRLESSGGSVKKRGRPSRVDAVKLADAESIERGNIDRMAKRLGVTPARVKRELSKR